MFRVMSKKEKSKQLIITYHLDGGGIEYYDKDKLSINEWRLIEDIIKQIIHTKLQNP